MDILQKVGMAMDSPSSPIPVIPEDFSDTEIIDSDSPAKNG